MKLFQCFLVTGKNTASKIRKHFKATTTNVIIFWEFLMFYQLFLSAQVQRSLIISNKLIYTNCFTSCRTTSNLGKFRVTSKLHRIISLCLVFLPKILSIVAKNCLKTFPVVHYFTWKLKFFSNIWSVVAVFFWL